MVNSVFDAVIPGGKPLVIGDEPIGGEGPNQGSALAANWFAEKPIAIVVAKPVKGEPEFSDLPHTPEMR